MIVGIHPDRIGQESYSEKWEQFLGERGVEVRGLNLLSNEYLADVRDCEGVMWRWAHNPQDKQSAKRILYTIEHYLKIPVYPDWKTAWHYDEKIAQFYLLTSIQAKTPTTWLFWDQEKALIWAQQAKYPLVFKLSVGAGSSNVVKLESIKQANEMIYYSFNRGIFPMTMNEYQYSPLPRTGRQLRALLFRIVQASYYICFNKYPVLPKKFWKPEFGYVYFQEFLQDNQFDTRISVIGDRAFGFRRMNRPHDFRASGSGIIDYDPSFIDPRCISLAFNISKQCNFQSMAYDFLMKGDCPVIVEISYAFADWAVYKCSGFWDPDLKWHDLWLWPEEAQVEDFINRIIRLKEKK